jgi:acyl carrier protein
VAVAVAEPRVAVRGGQPLVPRLLAGRSGASGVRSDVGQTGGGGGSPEAIAPRVIDPDGTVLVTGGTGLLGRSVARHLAARHGVRRLVLLSRAGLAAAGAAELVAELAALGATVRVIAGDAGDRAAVAAVLADVPAAHPWTAVVHAAGALQDALIADQTAEGLAAVMRSKVDAALVLDESTRGLGLAAFVLFSAGAGVFGNPGQANYAAANVFLDAVAAGRRAAGEAAVSLAWGPWEGGGMVDERLTELDRVRLRRDGSRMLTPAAGLALFDEALARPEALLVPMAFDGQALARSGAEVPEILRRLVRVPRRRAAEGQGAGFVERLAALPEHQRTAAAWEKVRATAAAVLGHADAGALAVDTGFMDLGLDSLMAVELRNRLQRAIGVALPATVVFEHPTPRLLGDFLLAQLGLATAAPDYTDAEVRDKLAQVSLAALREAGLLAALMKLPDAAATAASDLTRQIVDADADALADLLEGMLDE